MLCKIRKHFFSRPAHSKSQVTPTNCAAEKSLNDEVDQGDLRCFEIPNISTQSCSSTSATAGENNDPKYFLKTLQGGSNELDAWVPHPDQIHAGLGQGSSIKVRRNSIGACSSRKVTCLAGNQAHEAKKVADPKPKESVYMRMDMHLQRMNQQQHEEVELPYMRSRAMLSQLPRTTSTSTYISINPQTIDVDTLPMEELNRMPSSSSISSFMTDSYAKYSMRNFQLPSRIVSNGFRLPRGCASSQRRTESASDSDGQSAPPTLVEPLYVNGHVTVSSNSSAIPWYHGKVAHINARMSQMRNEVEASRRSDSRSGCHSAMSTLQSNSSELNMDALSYKSQASSTDHYDTMVDTSIETEEDNYGSLPDVCLGFSKSTALKPSATSHMTSSVPSEKSRSSSVTSSVTSAQTDCFDSTSSYFNDDTESVASTVTSGMSEVVSEQYLAVQRVIQVERRFVERLRDLKTLRVYLQRSLPQNHISTIFQNIDTLMKISEYCLPRLVRLLRPTSNRKSLDFLNPSLSGRESLVGVVTVYGSCTDWLCEAHVMYTRGLSSALELCDQLIDANVLVFQEVDFDLLMDLMQYPSYHLLYLIQALQDLSSIGSQCTARLIDVITSSMRSAFESLGETYSVNSDYNNNLTSMVDVISDTSGVYDTTVQSSGCASESNTLISCPSSEGNHYENDAQQQTGNGDQKEKSSGLMEEQLVDREMVRQPGDGASDVSMSRNVRVFQVGQLKKFTKRVTSSSSAVLTHVEDF